MVWIKLLETAPQGRDIDLPDSVQHRSVEGDALLLIPGTSQEVTEQEWAHIQAQHKDLLPHIQVLSTGV